MNNCAAVKLKHSRRFEINSLKQNFLVIINFHRGKFQVMINISGRCSHYRVSVSVSATPYRPRRATLHCSGPIRVASLFGDMAQDPDRKWKCARTRGACAREMCGSAARKSNIGVLSHKICISVELLDDPTTEERDFCRGFTATEGYLSRFKDARTIIAAHHDHPE